MQFWFWFLFNGVRFPFVSTFSKTFIFLNNKLLYYPTIDDLKGLKAKYYATQYMYRVYADRII